MAVSPTTLLPTHHQPQAVQPALHDAVRREVRRTQRVRGDVADDRVRVVDVEDFKGGDHAQAVDPEWGKNIAVSNYYVGKTMSKLGVILTGRKLGDRQFEVKVLFQEGAWKIDEVKFSD